jgi:hypothetical protein
MNMAGWIGLGAQLAGFATVADELRRRRAQHSDRPGILAAAARPLGQLKERTAAFVRRHLHRGPDRVIHASDSVNATATASAVAIGEAGLAPLNPGLSEADQLAELDVRTRHLQDLVNLVRRELRAEGDARNMVDQEERTARIAAVLAVDRRVTELAVGSLNAERWGTLLFVLGTILSAFG